MKRRYLGILVAMVFGLGLAGCSGSGGGVNSGSVAAINDLAPITSDGGDNYNGHPETQPGPEVPPVPAKIELRKVTATKAVISWNDFNVGLGYRVSLNGETWANVAKPEIELLGLLPGNAYDVKIKGLGQPYMEPLRLQFFTRPAADFDETQFEGPSDGGNAIVVTEFEGQKYLLLFQEVDGGKLGDLENQKGDNVILPIESISWQQIESTFTGTGANAMFYGTVTENGMTVMPVPSTVNDGVIRTYTEEDIYNLQLWSFQFQGMGLARVDGYRMSFGPNTDELPFVGYNNWDGSVSVDMGTSVPHSLVDADGNKFYYNPAAQQVIGIQIMSKSLGNEHKDPREAQDGVALAQYYSWSQTLFADIPGVPAEPFHVVVVLKDLESGEHIWLQFVPAADEIDTWGAEYDGEGTFTPYPSYDDEDDGMM